MNEKYVAVYEGDGFECIPEMVEFFENLNLTKEEGYNWGFIRTLLSSSADTAIIQMQDILGLSKGARMNTPSKVDGNWTWRMRPECVNDWLARIIREKTDLYRRLPNKNGNN